MRESQKAAHDRYMATRAGKIARANANAQYWLKELDRLKADEAASDEGSVQDAVGAAAYRAAVCRILDNISDAGMLRRIYRYAEIVHIKG